MDGVDLTHLHLHVRDRGVSAAFYRRWFGLQIEKAGQEITFMRGDRSFLLALMEDSAPAPMPPWFHFGISIGSPQGVRDTLAAMEAAAVPIVKPLYADDTLVSFRCADPDDYRIEVYWEATR